MFLLSTLLVQSILSIFISGILFSFSDFILKAFDNLPAKNAINAMQNINETVYRSLFMLIFVSLVPISIITAIWSITILGWSASLFVIIGTIFYIFGMFLVTGRGNVPLNDLLKGVDIHGVEVNKTWKLYYIKWKRLNTVRCVLGLLAGVSWIAAVNVNI